MGCCDQHMLREKDVSILLRVDIRAWASAGALFSEYYPIQLEPRTLIRCFEIEGIDRR